MEILKEDKTRVSKKTECGFRFPVLVEVSYFLVSPFAVESRPLAPNFILLFFGVEFTF